MTCGVPAPIPNVISEVISSQACHGMNTVMELIYSYLDEKKALPICCSFATFAFPIRLVPPPHTRIFTSILLFSGVHLATQKQRFNIVHFEKGFLKIDLFGDHLSEHQESPHTKTDV